MLMGDTIIMVLKNIYDNETRHLEQTYNDSAY